MFVEKGNCQHEQCATTTTTTTKGGYIAGQEMWERRLTISIIVTMMTGVGAKAAAAKGRLPYK